MNRDNVAFNYSVTYEQRDGKTYFKQVEVPGHPDFKILADATSPASVQSEKDFRTGYYQAIATMLSAIQRGGKYEQGYQHGVDALCSRMKSKGRLSASDLEGWVGEMGRRWMEEVPMDVQAIPPTLVQNQGS